MEEQDNSARSGKGINWTLIIIGAVTLGAAFLFFSNKASAAPVLPPVPVPPNADNSRYSLGYWAWKIKKVMMWWQVTDQKARIAKKSFDTQLWEDAQTKVTNMDVVFPDIDIFKNLVDARVIADTSSFATPDLKFENAIKYIVSSTPKATSATVYGDLLVKERATGSNPASMAGIK